MTGRGLGTRVAAVLAGALALRDALTPVADAGAEPPGHGFPHDRTEEDMRDSRTDTRARIAAYLSRFFPVHDLNDDDIFALGFVSPMFAMQLVSFVEHEFGVTVENEDLELEDFRSVSALDAFVTRKLSAAVPQ